ncbi:MAG: hypothetical protein ACYC91_02900 [Solirubrobacteraceae bacterium]
MHTELAVVTPLPAPLPRVISSHGRRRHDPIEMLLLAGFGAISAWVLALDLWQVVIHGRVWTGTDGFFVVDQMQYLAWIQAASHHVLASNLFVLTPTSADYFQPAIAISGGLSALGMAPWLALLLWKPVAVGGTFLAVRAYAYRNLWGRSQRRAAVALGLFFGSFTVVYGTTGVIGDLMPGFLSWGYPFGLLALTAMVFGLLGYDRARRRRRLSLVPALLGAIASSLHPWQGELLAVIVVGAELWSLRSERLTRARLSLAVVTVVGTALPLLYYLLLGKLDLSWGLARDAMKHSFPLWAIVLALAPLALPALLGYRRPARGFLSTLTRAWPPAALIVYFVSASGVSATPLHAFEGITVPLALLAVDGLSGRFVSARRPARRRRGPWLRTGLIGVAAVALATIPANVYELSVADEFMAPTSGNANFITRDEHDALAYLHSARDAGGVLTRFYLGAVVPAGTGRRTYVGNCLWSQPGCAPRAQVVQKLFDGRLSSTSARVFVAQSGARFVLADCQSTAELRRELAPLLISERQFGCAAVYEVRSASAPSGL